MIDGNIIKHVKGSFFRSNSIIIAKHDFNGQSKVVEVRIAKKTKSVVTGCQIFLDKQKIGGDESINYPDLAKAKALLEKGFFHYFITTGLLNFGLPYAILMAVQNIHDATLTMTWKFIFNDIYFGLFMSYYVWRDITSGVKAFEIYNES